VFYLKLADDLGAVVDVLAVRQLERATEVEEVVVRRYPLQRRRVDLNVHIISSHIVGTELDWTTWSAGAVLAPAVWGPMGGRGLRRGACHRKNLVSYNYVQIWSC